jgi:hypothetical protein
MGLPIPSSTYKPIVIEASSYDETGRVVSFDDIDTPQREYILNVSIIVYSGTALVNLEGKSGGKKIKLPAGLPFDFPVAAGEIFIQGLGGPCEACVVGALYGG